MEEKTSIYKFIWQTLTDTQNVGVRCNHNFRYTRCCLYNKAAGPIFTKKVAVFNYRSTFYHCRRHAKAPGHPIFLTRFTLVIRGQKIRDSHGRHSPQFIIFWVNSFLLLQNKSLWDVGWIPDKAATKCVLSKNPNNYRIFHVSTYCKEIDIGTYFKYKMSIKLSLRNVEGWELCHWFVIKSIRTRSVPDSFSIFNEVQ